MASTKQMQERARLKRLTQRLQQQHPDCEVMAPSEPVALYFTDDHVQDKPYLIIGLPEGMQAYRTALVNIGYIPAGSDAPVVGFNTGYGLSYFSKVKGGTPRAREILINVFADGNESGDMLQISATEVEGTYKEEQLVSQAIMSLPAQIKNRFGNKRLKVESGTSPVKLGLAPRLTDIAKRLGI